MFSYYVKIAFRRVSHDRFISTVSIFGLSISICCSIIIALFLKHELSYDKQHPDANHTYRVIWRQNDGVVWVPAGSWLLSRGFAEYAPEVEGVSLLDPKWGGRPHIDAGGKEFIEQNNRVFQVTDNLFDFFDVNLIVGDPVTSLAEPGSILISKGKAKKYFGDSDALGEVITIDKKYHYAVAGVFEDTQENSHVKFDLLTSAETNSDWLWPYCYLRIRADAKPESVQDKLNEFHRIHLPQSFDGGNRFELQPLTKIHLNSHYDYEVEPNSSRDIILAIGIIGLLILTMGCVNFINLSLANATRRTKEIGIRITTGGTRSQLVSQLLVETMVITLIATLLAVLFSFALSPHFNQIASKPIGVPWMSSWFWYCLTVGALLLGLISGILPALILSGFQMKHLHNREGTRKGKNSFRQMLMIFQFAISILLISATIMMHDQIRHLEERPLGFNKEHTMGIFLGSDLNNIDRLQIDRLQKIWSRYPGVITTATAQSLPTRLENIGLTKMLAEGHSKELAFYHNQVEAGFVKTLGLQLLMGRTFDKNQATDSTQSAIINRSAWNMLGWDDPIGRKLTFTNAGQRHSVNIVGVIEDFHDRNLREKIPPMVLTGESFRPWYLAVRLSPTSDSELVNQLGTSWSSVFPDIPFDYFFLDSLFDVFHEEEKTSIQVLATSSVIAIIIANLGLLGLTVFLTERRKQEFGIRKAIGAHTHEILRIIAFHFTRLIVLAVLLIVPIYHFALAKWLEGFAYKSNLGLQPLIFGFGFCLVISVLTASYHSLKAASANPVDSLKYE